MRLFTPFYMNDWNFQDPRRNRDIEKVKGVSNQRKLARIATRAPDDGYRTEAAAKLDDAALLERIALRRSQGDSSGGIVECSVLGLPAGLGDPMFGGMENRIAAIVFGIPAVKGVEFGAGFGAARSIGSVNNDPFTVEDGQVRTVTNNAGGILGGITDGMPIILRAAIKPTPSISQEQHTIDLKEQRDAILTVGGRHDPCIVPRALPAIESAVAIGLADLMKEVGKL